MKNLVIDCFQEEKDSLIDLIIWYKTEYHKKDFGHDELIEKVNASKNKDDLNLIWEIVDGWF